MRRATMAATILLGGCGNLLQGSLTADWPQDSHVTITPDECESGERNGFFGVDMWTAGNEEAHIRGILDAKDGPVVKLDIPGLDQQVTLTAASKCELFEFHVERQDARTNHIQHVRGHLRLDCNESGLALAGDISFADCH